MIRRFSVEEYQQAITISLEAVARPGPEITHLPWWFEIAFKAVLDNEISDIWDRRAEEEVTGE